MVQYHNLTWKPELFQAPQDPRPGHDVPTPLTPFRRPCPITALVKKFKLMNTPFRSYKRDVRNIVVDDFLSEVSDFYNSFSHPELQAATCTSLKLTEINRANTPFYLENVLGKGSERLHAHLHTKSH